MKIKKLILIDLDGVLNEYKGDYDEKYIPQIKEGAFDFIKELSKRYRIKIFTSRNLILTVNWIMDNKLDKYIEDVTNIKSPSYLIIDDRCINFSGDYRELTGVISKFKPWYKQ